MKFQTTFLVFLFFIFPAGVLYSQSGEVLSFDGTDDRVVVDNDTHFGNLTQFTIEVWVKIRDHNAPHFVSGVEAIT